MLATNIEISVGEGISYLTGRVQSSAPLVNILLICCMMCCRTWIALTVVLKLWVNVWWDVKQTSWKLKGNVVNPMKSETEPHMRIHMWIGPCAAGLIKGQPTARSLECSQSDKHEPQQILQGLSWVSKMHYKAKSPFQLETVIFWTFVGLRKTLQVRGAELSALEAWGGT